MIDYGFLAGMTLALVAAFLSIHDEVRKLSGKYQRRAVALSRCSLFMSIISALFLIITYLGSNVETGLQILGAHAWVNTISSTLLISAWLALLGAVIYWLSAPKA